MIGLFDSGLGGLVILREFMHDLPKYGYVYLGDNGRAPYGTRPREEIYHYTVEGVRFLFDQGCSLVVLACNTSSAVALRKIQREELPKIGSEKKVLGVLVPTVEQITGVPWSQVNLPSMPQTDIRTIGLFATPMTVETQAYSREIQKRNPSIRVVEQSCPELVPAIEQGTADTRILRLIKRYWEAMQSQLKKQGQEPLPDAVLLGSTHYGLIRPLFQQVLPESVRLFDQSHIAGASLKNYLAHHPEMNQRLKQTRTSKFFTTGDAGTVSSLGSRFFGACVRFQSIKL